MTPNKHPEVRPVALITGASSGIGLALAKVLAEHGHDVVLLARTLDALEAAAGMIEGKFGVRAFALRKDLEDPAAPQETYDAIRAENMHVDVLVNNAGFGLGGEFMETDLDRELAMIQVNIAAVTQLTKIFGAPM